MSPVDGKARIFAVFFSIAVATSRPGTAARLTLEPDSGAGRTGEAVWIMGSGFAPSSTVSVELGGVALLPPYFLTDEKGNIPRRVAVLSGSLPSGQHSAAATDSERHRFGNAYLVRPTVTLDPPIGDGNAGATWLTDRAISPGGHMGMVFTLKGSGFPARCFMPADSARVGNAPTMHEPIRIGSDGVLPATTIIIASELKTGRYDLSLASDAGDVKFASVFHVSPWSVTDAILRRGIRDMLRRAESGIAGLAEYSAEELPPEELNNLKEDLEQAGRELKTDNFNSAEELAQRLLASIALLKKRGEAARRDRLGAVADVIASGFDAIQPPGSPPGRQAADTVARGREKLEAARDAIKANLFAEASGLLKEGNQLLKDARQELGREEKEDAAETIRW